MNGLVISNLVKHYPEFTLQLDCSVKEGSLTTLLGPSGCGKSTALSLITGIEAQNSGRIHLAGRDITDDPPWERNIGLVFQDYALFPNMNVSQNIAYGLKIRKVPKREIARKISMLMELMGLEGYEKRKPNELSGGEKQRAALARALAPEPDLLLLDEPLSALDAKLRIRLRGEIQRIQRELEVTTVYVTHDQEEALEISDEVIVMNRGHIEQTGTPQEIYTNPKTLFCGTFIGSSTRIPKDESTMFFRPEDVVLDPSSEQEMQLFHQAVLHRKHYRGFYYEYLFSWEQVTIHAYGDGSHPLGTSCTLGVPRRRCIMLRS